MMSTQSNSLEPIVNDGVARVSVLEQGRARSNIHLRRRASSSDACPAEIIQAKQLKITILYNTILISINILHQCQGRQNSIIIHRINLQPEHDIIV